MNGQRLEILLHERVGNVLVDLLGVIIGDDSSPSALGQHLSHPRFAEVGVEHQFDRADEDEVQDAQDISTVGEESVDARRQDG